MDDLKTGDVLLFDYEGKGYFGWWSAAIRYFTKSNISHIAMVLKDPTFINPTLKGTYIWESSYEGKPDPQDGKVKLGVQITPLAEVLDGYQGRIYLRRAQCVADSFNPTKLEELHKVVYDKPYDLVPTDWIEAAVQEDPEPQKTSRFWCSAFVGYLYTQCGLLVPETDWSILRPADFTQSAQHLSFTEDSNLGPMEHFY